MKIKFQVEKELEKGLALLLPELDVEAAAKADLKKANVSWDLKPDKKVKFNTYYPGLEKNKKLSAVIKNYKNYTFYSF